LLLFQATAELFMDNKVHLTLWRPLGFEDFRKKNA